MKKQPIRTAVVRTDLMSISEFARHYKFPRKKVYMMLAENLLDTEKIGNLTFINVSCKAVIDNARMVRGEGRGQWSRNITEKPYKSHSEEDMEFEKAWRESMGMEME